ncbi:XRE family transcriptional regulator [Myceligenerans crystallogenes]|uniref:helix-turn-helix domain-containing protein n=1 Tax=Myceligenerans crystallogenes TaxID=316335 RepID=UPI0031D615E8
MLAGLTPPRTQASVAETVEMTPDAFSRALSGKRGFSSIELARLAELLEVDIYWLITGAEDPHRLRVAARHDFDPTTGGRSTPTWESDLRVLEKVRLAYRQAYPGASEAPSRLPSTPDAVRTLLGEDFVRPFAARLELEAGVDVVRVHEIGTSYLLRIGGRHAVVMPTTGSWFRENWALAHELGHLAHQDLEDDVLGHSAPRPVSEERERAANAFAAELLLPEPALRRIDWRRAGPDVVADVVWSRGVSTKALANRLVSLRIAASRDVSDVLTWPTQRVLRQHPPAEPGEFDPITLRMEQAASRRFPVTLQERHREGIASGRLGAATLAWMLNVSEDSLDVDEPNPADPVEPDDLAATLGLAVP